jgi:hypothetical protein
MVGISQLVVKTNQSEFSLQWVMNGKFLTKWCALLLLKMDSRAQSEAVSGALAPDFLAVLVLMAL